MFLDDNELVTTTLFINNPNEDGTCHNLDVDMIEVCMKSDSKFHKIQSVKCLLLSWGCVIILPEKFGSE